MEGLLLISLAWAGDCGSEADLDSAEEAILSLELDTGRTHLARFEAGFACGTSTPQQLARYWLLTAGLASFSEDEDGTREAFVAARAADPEFWLESLGVDLQARWADAAPLGEPATITLSPEPTGYEVRVDGTVSESPLRLNPGLHVVQASSDDHAFGRVLTVGPGQDATIRTNLPVIEPAAPEPEPDPVSPENPPVLPRDPRAVSLYVGLGFDASIGEGWDGLDVTEPSARVGPQLEAGIVLRPGNAWVRVAAAGQVLLGGQFVYVKEGPDGLEASGLPVSPSLHAGGGITVSERIDLGVQAGAQLPSRVPLRAVGSVGFGPTFRVEARAGVNLAGEKGQNGEEITNALQIQPAGSVLLTAGF